MAGPRHDRKEWALRTFDLNIRLGWLGKAKIGTNPAAAHCRGQASNRSGVRRGKRKLMPSDSRIIMSKKEEIASVEGPSRSLETKDV